MKNKIHKSFNDNNVFRDRLPADKFGTVTSYLVNKNTAIDKFNIFWVNGKYIAQPAKERYNSVYEPLGTIGGLGIKYTKEEIKEMIIEMAKERALKRLNGKKSANKEG